MKQGSAIISIIVIVAVLLGALGIGLLVRELRSRRAASESKASADLNQQQLDATLRPRSPDASRNLSADERARLKDEREKMRLRWENMSDEEKQQYMARISERFSARRQEQPDRFSALPEAERAKLRQQWEQMRQNWPSMSEAEREKFRAQMRERFDARRREGKRGLTDLSPEEQARTREEIDSTSRRWQDMSPEERERYRARMRELLEARRQGNE